MNNLTPETFRKHLGKTLPKYSDKKFLVAVSGGVDSMVLLSLMKDLNINIHVAHINYGLRGENSDLDEKLVSEFCKKNHIDLHIYKVSEKDNQPENSIQEWARNLRYRFFHECLSAENLDYIVTAHHLNDQLETFLINLSKAAGIQGLTGIPENQNKTVRPLLKFSKEEIYRYAEENQIEFREDETNQKADYLRNKIRLEIVPKLLETNPYFLQNFSKSLEFLNQTKEFTSQKIEEINNEISRVESAKIFLNRAKFSQQENYVKFEILRKIGFENETEIEKIFSAETGKIFHSKEFQLTVEHNDFVIETENNEDSEIPEIIFENEETLKNFPFEFDLDFSETSWKLDTDKLKFPLILRQKKDGDYFFPIGMKGKKLASKFLKDEKIPILARSKIRMLCDAEGNIFGILPLRQDRRFAADDETKVKIEINFRKSSEKK